MKTIQRKTILLAGILLFTTSLALSRTTPSIQWEKSYGGSGNDYLTSIQPTSDGGFICAGYTNSTDGDIAHHYGTATNYDYWIVKLDSAGAMQWQRTFGGSKNDFASSIAQTKDGGYIVAGYSNSSDGNVTVNHGGADYWILKLDSQGNITWQNSLGGSGEDIATCIRQTFDGGYIIAGSSSSKDGDASTNFGNYDYWIVKLDTNGRLTWQRSLGGSADDEANSIWQTSDSGYIIAGWSYSSDSNVTNNNGGADYWIVKLDTIGNILWQRSIGGSRNDEPYDIRQTRDGGYVVAGNSSSTDGNVTGNHGATDYWVVKLIDPGIILWQQSYGGSNEDQALAVCPTKDNGTIITGYTNSNDWDVSGNHGNTDYWIVKTDSNGVKQWQKCLGGSNNESATSILQLNDSEYVVAGDGGSNDGDETGNHGNSDFWIVKLSPTVSAVSEPTTEPFNMLSCTNYPNPFSTTTTLSYTISDEKLNGAKLRLTLYDALGDLVKILYNGHAKVETAELQIQANDLESGLYYYRLECGGQVLVKTLFVIK